jgi:translation initiation factor IF-3
MKKRSYLLPAGCKNLGETKKKQPRRPALPRINGKIRAPEVAMLDEQGKDLGIVSLRTALARARKVRLDLIEIDPGARPPVCTLMDFGKFMFWRSRLKKL